MEFFTEVCMIVIKSTKRIFEWKMLFYISYLLIPPSSQFMPVDDTVVCINVGCNVGSLYLTFLLISLTTN